MNNSGPNVVKVVMLGDTSAGKTAVLSRYLHDKFEPDRQSTIGMDFFLKEVPLGNGDHLRLQVWDTAGQERFRQLMPAYIREASIAIIVFDLTSRASLEGLRRWILIVQRERGNYAKIVIVGNKSDLMEKREVSPAEVEELLGMIDNPPYVETSAKTGENIAQLFDVIISLPIVIDPDQRQRSRTFQLSTSSTKYTSRCGRC